MTDPNASPRRRPDGFVERGHQVTRLEAFVDAAFAFAVTMLVISDAMPGTVRELLVDLRLLPGLACSFMLIAMFWLAHNRWSRRYGLDDLPSILLSLVLVFLVLAYIYPLRMLFGSLFAWLSELALPREWRVPWTFRLEGRQDIVSMFIVYAVVWSTLGFVIALLYRHASKKAEELGLSAHEKIETHVEVAAWLVVPATGLLSLAVALLLPDDVPGWALGSPGFVYFLMFLTGPVTIFARRNAARRFAQSV